MSGLAFLFPGQGSQKAGMGRDIADRYPEVVDRYYRVADEILGFPLSELCWEGPDEDLRRTEITQPAIFLTSMVIADRMRSAGVRPDVVAGHSLGEFSALVCAGVLDWTDALRLVRRRGELMASVDQRTPGAMAAVIGLPADLVDDLCAAGRTASGTVVEAANYNDPLQTVISGTAYGVDYVMKAATSAGAEKVTRLKVGAPFHCSLMRDVEDEFAAVLDTVSFSDPEIPVIANVSADYVRTADEVRAALRAQLAGSVRWAETMRRLTAGGDVRLISMGPGRTIHGLCRTNCPDTDLHAANDLRRLERTCTALMPNPR